MTLYSGYPSPDLDLVALLVRFTQELSDAVPVGEAVAINGVEVNRVDVVERVTLFYRTGGEASFSEVDLDQVEGAYQGAIPAEAITDRGIAFYVGADDADGNTARAPSDGVLSFPVRVPDEGIVKGSAQPSGSTQSDYRLISMPMTPDDAAPSAVLEDDLGEYDNTEWRFFEGARTSGSAGAEFGNTAEMTPGRAFWLIVRDASEPIDTGAGNVLPIDAPHDEVELQEGWNYVANPYNFPLPVSNLQRDSGNPVGQLFRYDGSWEAITSENAMLPPFSGVALRSDGRDTLAFDPTPSNGSNAAQQKLLAASMEDRWNWSIAIAGRSRQQVDRHNIAAVARGGRGRRGRDGLARTACAWARAVRHVRPPRVAERPCELPRRRPQRADARRDVALHGARDPPRSGVALVRPARAGPRILRGVAVRRVQQGLAEPAHDAPLYARRREHAAGSARCASSWAGTRTCSRSSRPPARCPPPMPLADVYPNPTHGAATIRYGLPKKQPVTIEVYNTLGQRVATLMQDRPTEPGFHTIQWRGETGSGTPVASGVYFVRMRAGDFTASKKIVRVN